MNDDADEILNAYHNLWLLDEIWRPAAERAAPIGRAKGLPRPEGCDGYYSLGYRLSASGADTVHRLAVQVPEHPVRLEGVADSHGSRIQAVSRQGPEGQEAETAEPFKLLGLRPDPFGQLHGRAVQLAPVLRKGHRNAGDPLQDAAAAVGRRFQIDEGPSSGGEVIPMTQRR
jgi:hypothetical protein